MGSERSPHGREVAALQLLAPVIGRFAPTLEHFEFARVERVEIRTDTFRDRPVGSHEEEVWYFVNKAGDRRRLVLGDLWRAHEERLLELLRIRGVAVSR